jgi:hypothetical protein
MASGRDCHWLIMSRYTAYAASSESRSTAREKGSSGDVEDVEAGADGYADADADAGDADAEATDEAEAEAEPTHSTQNALASTLDNNAVIPFELLR